ICLAVIQIIINGRPAPQSDRPYGARPEPDSTNGFAGRCSLLTLGNQTAQGSRSIPDRIPRAPWSSDPAATYLMPDFEPSSEPTRKRGKPGPPEIRISIVSAGRSSVEDFGNVPSYCWKRSAFNADNVSINGVT